MRAVEFEGGKASIGEMDDPEPGHRQLLVAVRAAGLNGADLAQAAGGYPPPPGAPSTGGLEMAGEVVATGTGCQRFSVGDRVMAVVQGGGQAELCAVDEAAGHAGARVDGLGERRWFPRGVRHRPRRPVHPGRLVHGGAGVRPRRGGRGGNGRGAAGRGRPGPR